MQYSIGLEEKNLPLFDILTLKCSKFIPKGIHWSISESEDEPAQLCLLEAYPSDKEENDETCTKAVSDVIISIMAEELAESMIIRLINKKYPTLEPMDKARIFCYVWCWIKKNQNWTHSLDGCIADGLVSGQLILDGVLRFRMKEQISCWDGYVESAYNTIIVENEYQEFIKILQYFVNMQSPQIDEVHVNVQRGGKYILLDKDLTQLDNEIALALEAENEGSMNDEDILISSLITIAPGKIIIHGAENAKNPQILDTIKKVFNERVLTLDK